jgi:MerR family redox-sensitive transcriptional activator SoxR
LKSSPRIGSEVALSIGQLAERAGVAPSALRFYEARGLLGSRRTGGGHRAYARSELRRVAFIRAAQAVGLSLEDIQSALTALPEHRTPTVADWERLSRGWQAMLDARIAALTALRDRLTTCIGCGCLSLKRCRLYNPQDVAAARGPGPRYLMGDRPAAPGTDAAAAQAVRVLRRGGAPR